jgi:hypothetical protein
MLARRDRLLGLKLLSVRAVVVSACFSLASLFLVCSPGLATPLLFELNDFTYYDIIIGLIVLGILPALLGTRRRKKVLQILLQIVWLLAVSCLGLLALACMDIVDWFNLPYKLRGAGIQLSIGIDFSVEILYYLAFIVLTVASDALFIAVTRWLLRKSSKSDSRVKILGLMLGNVLLACTLVVTPLALAWGFSGVRTIIHSGSPVDNVVAYASKSNPHQAFLSSELSR